VNHIAKIEDRRTGCKHRGRLPRVLHHGSLHDIARLDAVMEVPGKLLAGSEFADRTDDLHPSQPVHAAMIHSLTISGYRGFGRVNLLVGTNNCGKTSVLMALYLLASGGDANAIWRIVARRGERIYLETPSRQQPDLKGHWRRRES
jgi:hypothetical protein